MSGTLVVALLYIAVLGVLSFACARPDTRAAGEHHNAAGGVAWKLVETSGQRPSERGAGRWVAVGDTLVAFGGFRECFNKAASGCDHTYFSDIHTLDLGTGRWQKRNPRLQSGEGPAVRAFIGGAAYERNGTAIFFGGADYNAKLTSYKAYGDMWEFDPVADTLTRRVYANQAPGPRLGPGIAIVGDTLYLFGGVDHKQVNHSCLWAYDLRTNTWRELKDDGAPGSPPHRYIFLFELDDAQENIYLHAGNFRDESTDYYSVQRNDTWRYNIPANRFEKVLSEGRTNIAGRTHSAGAAFDDRFLVALGDLHHGGCLVNQHSEQQNPTDEVWQVRVDDLASDPLYERVKIRSGPPPLKRSHYAKARNHLYVSHGFGFECNEAGEGGAIYNLETYRLALDPIR